MEIRLMTTPDELEALLALDERLADAMKALVPDALMPAFEGASFDASAPHWQDMLQGEKGFSLLAYEDGAAIGMAVVALGRFAHLESLFADEAARAKNEAAKRGRGAMTLYVLRDNERARALYQKCGFEDFRRMMYVKL